MSRRRIERLAAVVVLAGVLGGMLAAAPRQLTTRADDIGLLMLETPDEHLIASAIYRMHAEKTLDYGISPYGGVYPNTAYLFTKPLMRARGLDQERLIVALRWFSLAAALVAVCAVFVLGVVVTGRWAVGAIATVLTALTPELLHWSVRIHPDTFLNVLLTAALVLLAAALERRSQRLLLAAFVVAVLAAMTKVVGVFLLPWLLLGQLYLDALAGRAIGGRFIARRLAQGAVLAAALAYATTPTLLVDSSGFFRGLVGQARANAQALGFHEQAPLGWLSLLAGPRLLGIVALLLFSLWLLTLVRPTWQELRRFLRVPAPLPAALLRALVVGSFTAGYLAYLFLGARLYVPRYLLPAAPGIAVGAAAAAVLAFDHAPGIAAYVRAARAWARGAWVALAAVVLVVEAPGRLATERAELATPEVAEAPAGAEVGDWLAATAARGSRIVYDYGVYVPFAFHRARKTYCLLSVQLRQWDPEYVLLADERREVFREFTAAVRDRERALGEDCRQTLEALERGAISGFVRERRFERARVTVYRNMAALPCAAACD